MLVDGLQDGGRVNNTQLIALSLVPERKKYCHRQTQRSVKQHHLKLVVFLQPVAQNRRIL